MVVGMVRMVMVVFEVVLCYWCCDGVRCGVVVHDGSSSADVSWSGVSGRSGSLCRNGTGMSESWKRRRRRRSSLLTWKTLGSSALMARQVFNEFIYNSLLINTKTHLLHYLPSHILRFFFFYILSIVY